MIGTEEGLVLFDGFAFQQISEISIPAVPQLYFEDILIAGERIWLAARGGGVVRIEADEVTRFATGTGFPSDYVQVLKLGADDNVWMGTRDQGVLRVDPDGRVVDHLRTSDGLSDNFVFDISRPVGDTAYIATRGGIDAIEISGSSLGTLTRLLDVPALALAVTDSHVYFSTDEPAHVARIPRTGAPVPEVLVNGVVALDLHIDPAGSLWFSTTEKGIGWLSDAGDPVYFDDQRGLPDNYVFTSLVGSAGGLWVGTATSGLSLLRKPVVGSLDQTDGLQTDTALSLAAGQDRGMLVGTAGGGLYRVIGTDVQPILEDGLPSDVILAVHESADGSLWVGTRNGLVMSQAGSVRILTTADGLPSNGISALAQDPEAGLLWVGTAAGLASIADERITTYDAPGLPVTPVFSLLAEADGVLVGERGLFHFDGTNVSRLGSEILQSEEVLAIHRDETDPGVLWIGTAKAGLFRLDSTSERQFGKAEGFASDGVMSITSDGRGHLVICTLDGVLIAEKDRLNSVATGDAPSIDGIVLTTTDGMPSNECNGGFHPASATDAQGRVWLPTMGGVAIVDTARALAPPPVPEIVFTGMNVEGIPRTLLPDPSSTELAAGTSQVGFTFTASIPEMLGNFNFDYRMTGVDDSWKSAGTRREAVYNNLGPGHYAFEVRGQASRRASLRFVSRTEFEIKPFFWQRAWVQSGGVLLGGLLIAALIRAGNRSLRDRNRELEQACSARDEALQAALRATQQYKALLINAREAILQTDQNGRILETNDRADAFLRYCATGLIGTPVYDVIQFSNSQPITELAGLVGKLVLTRPRPDPNNEVMEMSVRRLGEKEGGPGFLLLGRDISERQQLEAQLRQAQKMEAVGRLSASVAHDFRNFLTVISGCTELLRMKCDADAQEELNDISKAAQQGAVLANQLLEFSRPGHSRGSFEERDMNAVLQSVQALLERIAGTSIELRYALCESPLPIRVDEAEFGQVLMNLVVNARDAMEGTGTITVRTEAHEQEAILRVKDTGPGIEGENLERIFEPFFTTRQKAGGTGLGLATSFRIVQDHRGRLLVQTQPGQGTEFSIHIPLSDKAPMVADSV